MLLPSQTWFIAACLQRRLPCLTMGALRKMLPIIGLRWPSYQPHGNRIGKNRELRRGIMFFFNCYFHGQIDMSGILQGVEHSAVVCLQYSKHVYDYFFFWQFAPLLITPLLIPVFWTQSSAKDQCTIVFECTLHRSIPSWTCSGGLGLVHVRSSY